MLELNVSDPFRGFNNTTGRTVLIWKEDPKVYRARPLGFWVNEIDPSKFLRCRRGYNYPHRRNYESWYPFTSSGDFIWCESLVELRCLELLEHTERIASIASQPFCLVFPDNTRHYPDLFAVSTDGSRTIYDIKPLELIGDVDLRKFTQTTDECNILGWSHVVLHDVLGYERKNLEWLACFRTEDMHPSIEAEERLTSYLEVPRSLAQAAAFIDFGNPAFVMPGLYHLMFRQVLAYGHDGPISLDTKIWRGRTQCNV